MSIPLSTASQWWTVWVTCAKVTDDPAARWVSVHAVIQACQDNGKVKTRRVGVVENWIVGETQYDRVVARLGGGATQSGEPHTANVDPRPTPPELAAAVAALQQDDFAQAEHRAWPYRQHTDQQTRADALRICALSLAPRSVERGI